MEKPKPKIEVSWKEERPLKFRHLEADTGAGYVSFIMCRKPKEKFDRVMYISSGKSPVSHSLIAELAAEIDDPSGNALVDDETAICGGVFSVAERRIIRPSFLFGDIPWWASDSIERHLDKKFSQPKMGNDDNF